MSLVLLVVTVIVRSVQLLVEMRYTKCPVMFAHKTRIVPSKIPVEPLYTEITSALGF